MVGDVIFGPLASTRIYLRDDESTSGAKSIHANSNVIGFLTGAGSWQSYWDNSGNQYNTGAITLGGNLTFNVANPTISASSYFIAPGGAYFNSGTVYMAAALQARGGIHNDNAAYLTISGGTSGNTYFSGNVGIGNTSPSYKLDVAGQIRSSSGGFTFPDGTTQTTAANLGGKTWVTIAESSITLNSGSEVSGIANIQAASKSHRFYRVSVYSSTTGQVREGYWPGSGAYYALIRNTTGYDILTISHTDIDTETYVYKVDEWK
ncbi:TPA: hypothetical protein DDZ49_00570 [Candidatus Wolfebacteria bacterium]|nr:hypothetical protein [Candidatus Wolfebacteria bacterium]